jgi:acetyl-CoA carboxylase carboxyltransferase component
MPGGNYKKLYAEYEQKRQRIKEMGGEKAVDRQHRAGKLTARERIEYFFDPHTFTEMGIYVRPRTTVFGMEGREVPAEGVIVGFGKVGGRNVMVAAEDYTTMAGTFGEYHGKKFAEAIDFAKDKMIPLVVMNDSGGARLQEGMDSLESYAWLFRSQILASGVIPQISLLMGPCLGGQAYHPVMQDFVIQCRHTGFMGIAGPAFVKTQTGEDISLEKLCGVEAHAVITGQTHLVAEDDKHCLDLAKQLLTYLPQNNRDQPPALDIGDDPQRIIEDLDELVPFDHDKPFDMHLVIERIVDQGSFFEILPKHARNIITGFARLGGRAVGIVASQPNWLSGGIDCDASDKGARFIRFCDLFNIPLINLHDTPGYWIGSRHEWAGILRHGAKMLYANIDATVPKVSLILRKSYAGAYTGMCSKDTGADIVFAWPNARVSIVGAETAASVIFAKEIRNADDPQAVKAKRLQEYDDYYGNPYRAAERGYIDDVIMPSQTRFYLNRALDILEHKTVTRPWRKFSNINL